MTKRTFWLRFALTIVLVDAITLFLLYITR